MLFSGFIHVSLLRVAVFFFILAFPPLTICCLWLLLTNENENEIENCNCNLKTTSALIFVTKCSHVQMPIAVVVVAMHLVTNCCSYFFFFWLGIEMSFQNSLTVKLLFYIDIYVFTEILNIRRLKAGPERKKKYFLYNPYLWIILENMFLF